MPDPRLAEARAREAESRKALQFLVISQLHTPTVLAQAKADVDVDRRATDEALVAAALPMYGRELTSRFQDVYWHALADVSDEEFATACTRVMRELKQFPTPADILDRVPPHADADLEVKAARIFLQIVGSPHHNPRRGSYWREEEIARHFGQAAADAFVVAGATAGFRAALDPERERFIRRDFIAAFVRLAKANPSALAAVPAPALQPEATAILSLVKEKLSLPAPRIGEADIARRKQAWRPREGA